MDKLIANRLGGKDFFKQKDFYRFSNLIRQKEEIKKMNPDIELLDFGIGEPQDQVDKKILISFAKSIYQDKSNHYTDNGTKEYNDAVKNYMQRKYNVFLNDDEVMHCIGAKEALCILPMGFINKGDYVISTSPGYVVLENMAKWLDANIYHIGLKEENGFLFNFDNIEEEILLKTKILYINYPNNPTGQIANKKFYEDCIKYAKKYNFIIVVDATYLPLTYNKDKLLSFLSIEGAKDVGIEVHSLSKSYNMTGFRIGFVVGNNKIINVYSKVKENVDSGQYKPIMDVAIKALDNDEFVDKMIEKYKRRQSLLKRILLKLGYVSYYFDAGFFQYVKVPNYLNDEEVKSAYDFSTRLLKDEKIFVIPYDDEGKFIRFSLTFKGDNIKDDINYLEKLYERLKKYKIKY